MSDLPNVHVLTERMSQLSDDIRKMELGISKLSDSMLQMIEFKKEFEFLHTKTHSTEKRLISLEERVREGELSANSQKTINRMLSIIFSTVASISLAVGIYLAGASTKSADKINEVEKAVSVLQSQASNRVNLKINTGER